MKLSDAIKKVRPTVVQLSANLDGDPDKKKVIGSGFILDEDGTVATAAHVLVSLHELLNNGAQITAGLAYPNIENEAIGNVKSVTIESCFEFRSLAHPKINQGIDVGIAKIEPNPFTSPPMQLFEGCPTAQFARAEANTERPEEGAEIAVSGYPLNNNSMVTTAGHIACAWAKHEMEVWHPTAGLIKTSEDVFLADISINLGNSGGPAFCIETGAVIGVCIAYRIAPIVFADTKGGQVTVEKRPIGLNSGLAVIAPVKHAFELHSDSVSVSPPSDN